MDVLLGNFCPWISVLHRTMIKLRTETFVYITAQNVQEYKIISGQHTSVIQSNKRMYGKQPVYYQIPSIPENIVGRLIIVFLIFYEMYIHTSW